MLDGRVKTLHPKVHGGILARRDSPEHMAALARARHSDHRPRRRQSLSVPRDGREARLHARRRDREHRHRRPGDGARRGEELRSTSASSSTRRTTPRCSTELRAQRRGSATKTRFALAQKAFSHTAAYDGAISNYLDGARSHAARRGVSRIASTGRRQGAGPALRRESAPAGGVLSRRCSRRAGSIATYRAAAGQGAVVQQHRRQRCGVGMRARPSPSRACVIVKHANPCGVARRRDRRSSLSHARSPPTRPPPSAASSRSTARSTRRPSRR